MRLPTTDDANTQNVQPNAHHLYRTLGEFLASYYAPGLTEDSSARTEQEDVESTHFSFRNQGPRYQGEGSRLLSSRPAPSRRLQHLHATSPATHFFEVDGTRLKVAVGVDPGTFFCGGLARYLTEIGARRGIPTGFIHVPPDRDAAFKGHHLLPRSTLFAAIEQIIEHLIVNMMQERGMGGPVLVTGFGPFGDIKDNPTAAFASWWPSKASPPFMERSTPKESRGHTSRQGGLPDEVLPREVAPVGVMPFGVVLPLAATPSDATAGRYYRDMTPIYSKLDAYLESLATSTPPHHSEQHPSDQRRSYQHRPEQRRADQRGAPQKPALIIGLGVDSSQLVESEHPPTLIFEAASQGFSYNGVRDPLFSPLPLINLDLPVAFFPSVAGDNKPFHRCVGSPPPR